MAHTGWSRRRVGRNQPVTDNQVHLVAGIANSRQPGLPEVHTYVNLSRLRLSEPKESNMKNDVKNYIERRKRGDKTFAKDFEVGYGDFKIGVMLRQAREEAGVTQEKLARITKMKKSAISRLENHAEDVRLSTVSRVARALGKAVRIELVEAT